MRYVRVGLVLLGVLATVGVPVAAQEQRGSIVGIVTDASGAVLPGVTVTASSPAMPGVLSTVTDATGSYQFPALLPGTYTVAAELQGFTAAKTGGVEVRLGQVLKVDVTLRIAGVTESVQVTSESPLIDVKQSASFANIEREFIANIPKGRDFTDVVGVAPGANMEEGLLGGISIDGASGSENRFIVDGIDTTDQQTGESGKPLLTDFLEEVQVKSSGFPAEFGGATGGVINVISRAGSNDWTGDIVTYFESSDLQGATRPTLRLNPITDDAEYITYDDDNWTRFEPGFTLGGPIVRDRGWFFAGYIPTLENTDRTVTFLSNDETNTFESEERTHNFNANSTWQFLQNLRGQFAGSIGNYSERGRLPALSGADNPNFNYPGLGEDRPRSTLTATLDYVATPKLFFSARAGHYRQDFHEFGVPNEVWYQFGFSNVGMPGVPAEFQRAAGSLIPTNDATTKDLFTRTSLWADATYYGNFAGQHTFKAGLQFDRNGNEVISGYQQPRDIIYWDHAYTTSTGEIVRGTYGYHRVLQIVTTGNVASNNVALFAQDNWTLNNRLTLNLGLRTEREVVPSYAGGNPDLEFGFGQKIAPRLGFAWDIKGDSTWKAYGSWGVFYDQFKLELPRGSFGGDKWIDYFYTLDAFNFPTFVPAGGCTTDCGGGTFIEQLDRRHTSNDPSDPTLEPDLNPMRSQEITFGLDHELTNSVSVGARYVHKQLDEAIEDVGVLVPGIGERFYISNPGRGIAEFILGPEFPPQPRPIRDYDAIEFHVKKRLRDRWALDTSYTFSRLYGNYSGLASSDESGRTSPNVNRFFDALIMSYDENGNQILGRLGSDRPHQFKAYGYYQWPWGTTTGARFYAASGTPITREASIQFVPVQYLGRLSDGRTPVFSQTDLYLAHDFRLFGENRIQVSMNVMNLFDQDTTLEVFDNQTQQDVAVELADYFAGAVDIQQAIAEQEIARDPQFLMPSVFQARRGIRFAVKYIF